MSSLPGLHLEDLLAWNFDLTVEDQGEANTSLGIAEMLGNIKPRSALTKEQFKPIVDLYEEDRERAEDKLMDFDEDTSWRGYAGYAFDDILTDERHDWCIKYLKDLQWEKQA